MAQLKAPTTIGGVAVDPRGAAAGEGLVFDGAAFTPQPIDPGSGSLFLPLAGGVMVGDIDMDGHEIQNAVIPGYATDAELAGYLPLAGGIMAGDIDLDGNQLQNALGYFADGSAALPSYSFASEPDTGMYRSNVNNLAFATAGVAAAFFDANQNLSLLDHVLFGVDRIQVNDGSVSVLSIRFQDDSDLGFYRVGTNALGIVAAGALALTIDDASGTSRVYSPTGTRGWLLKEGTGSVALPIYTFRGDEDTGIYSNEADGIYLTAGNNAMFGLASGTVNGPGISAVTTGTAANVNVSTSGVRVLARFTSALKYKMKLHDADFLADIELKPQKFYRRDDKKWFYGFIADWLADQDPILGQYGEDGEIENYDAPAVMAILAAKVNRLTDRIKELEGSLPA